MTILSKIDAPAHGLRFPGATRSGDLHRVSFVPSARDGFMWVLLEDTMGFTPAEKTTEEARADYRRFRAGGAVPAAPRATFVGLDAFSRYVYTPAEVGHDGDRRAVKITTLGAKVTTGTRSEFAPSTSYVARSREECRGNADRSAYEMALTLGRIVKAGHILAQPLSL